MQMPAQAFKITQHLKTRDAQATCTHGGYRSVNTIGVTDEIFSGQHDLRKTGITHRLELGLEWASQG